LKAAAQSLKAIYATLVAALGALVTVLVGDAGFSDLTDGQWVSVILVGLVAGGGVYGLKNSE
jgi:hypothetical protein